MLLGDTSDILNGNVGSTKSPQVVAFMNERQAEERGKMG